MTRKIVIVSGGFDPVHIGHIKMFQDASKEGDVIIGLNSDAWLQRKKGYNFMDWEERKIILKELISVTDIIDFDDSDGTAINAIWKVIQKYPKADIMFANGGDRTYDNIPEVQFCSDNGIKLLWNVGGSKIQHSSHLVKRAKGHV